MCCFCRWLYLFWQSPILHRYDSWAWHRLPFNSLVLIFVSLVHWLWFPSLCVLLFLSFRELFLACVVWMVRDLLIVVADAVAFPFLWCAGLACVFYVYMYVHVRMWVCACPYVSVGACVFSWSHTSVWMLSCVADGPTNEGSSVLHSEVLPSNYRPYNTMGTRQGSDELHVLDIVQSIAHIHVLVFH